MPLQQVRQTLEAVHQRLIEKIQAFTDEDLHRPYSDYQPDSKLDRPVIVWLIGATYRHYDEHIPWIEAIVK
jgi:hypothetical protein